MPSFTYTAIGADGKKSRASLEAPSLEMAKHSLRGAGFTVCDIRPTAAMEKSFDIPFLGKPNAKEMSIFCRQFVSILRAGVPVNVVLSMLGQQTENRKLAAAIRDMRTDVEKGETLAGSMAKHRKIFPRMLVSMVAAGEESGNLEESFLQMEQYFEKAQRTKKSVSSAMLYPCILMAVMIGVVVIMMTVIIPSFTRSLEQTGTQLPALTLAVMAVSTWFEHWWWTLLLGAAGGFLLVRLIYRTNRGRHFFDAVKLKIPVFGKLQVQSCCATFCRTMSLLMGSGLSLLEGLDLTAANMTNILYEDAVNSIRTVVLQGWSLASGLQNSRRFPPLVCNLVSIGEESGDLQGTMARIADFYDEEVNESTKKILSMLEPAIIIIMGVMVLFLVLSIFLPMLTMTQQFDQYL